MSYLRIPRLYDTLICLAFRINGIVISEIVHTFNKNQSMHSLHKNGENEMGPNCRQVPPNVLVWPSFKPARTVRHVWSPVFTRDHIKPVLMILHWLPVEQRIQYKLLIQVYKVLNGLAPEYITDLLHAYVPTRALRSAGAHLLLEPKTITRVGSSSF